MKLEGTVEAGVEAGCMLLQAGGKTYNLVGGDKAMIKDGADVVVHGSEEPDMITTCQQGIPFRVTDVQKRR
ncbi:MAG: hypothetical protein ACRDT8_05235 [Micromonosporaceae bacterium]